ncbi:MAG: hypothetical protein ABL880_02270 [Methylotenera sp.]
MKTWKPWTWVHQFLLNYVGSFLGWICLWLLIGRTSAWIDSGYTNSPSYWEIFLMFVSFIGITGLLPWATTKLVENFKNSIKNYLIFSPLGEFLSFA